MKKMNEKPSFQFYSPTHIFFGAESLTKFLPTIHIYGRRPFVIVGKTILQTNNIEYRLKKNNRIKIDIFNHVEPEPSVNTVIEAFEVAKAHRFDSVIAIGGGSVIDVGKAVAILATNSAPLQSYEQEGSLKSPPLPLVAIPTTAGTGSEVTKYSVLNDTDLSRKFTIKSNLICPRVAIVDPSLTITLPKDVTASSGIDALTHALEAYLSLISQPITDSLCEKVIELVYYNLPIVLKDPTNIKARTNMSLAALMGGIIINNVRTGMMHTMSVAIGAHTKVPHGFGNSIFLSAVINYNKRHIEKRLCRLADNLGFPKNNRSDYIIDKFSMLMHTAGAPQTMSKVGITSKQIPALVNRVLQDKGLHNVNPRPFTGRDLYKLFNDVL